MSVLILLITALIWGVAFVSQSVGMDHLGPLYFNAIRYTLGTLVLIPVIAFLNRGKGKGIYIEHIKNNDTSVIKLTLYGRYTLLGGVCCGMCLATASLWQQYGIIGTTVAKAGFITALYIIIVPILGLFLHKKIRLNVWISAFIAIAGFFLMCVKETLSVNIYDLYVLVAACVFSVHIMVIDHFAPKGDPVAISSIQFLVSAIICLIGGIIFEEVSIDNIRDCTIPLLYSGILSCGVAYTLQIVGQRGLNPAVASLVLSLESVFSAVAGWLLIGQTMTRDQMIGAGLVFAGVILAQIDFSRRRVR